MEITDLNESLVAAFERVAKAFPLRIAVGSEVCPFGQREATMTAVAKEDVASGGMALSYAKRHFDFAFWMRDEQLVVEDDA